MSLKTSALSELPSRCSEFESQIQSHRHEQRRRQRRYGITHMLLAVAVVFLANFDYLGHLSFPNVPGASGSR